MPSGLVAAYGFDEIGGTSAYDGSGLGNHGTILGAVRVTGGRFGNALKFDGVNDWVTVNNSKTLALTTGMTVEAWVNPTTWMSGMSTVVMKEQPATSTSAGTETYLLAANNSTNQPMSVVRTGSEVAVGGTTQIPPNQWTHIATTYDGQYQNLYINGILVNMLPQTGPITTSTGLLRMGGNSLWGGFFQGYIDEVRIYNRALTQSEVINDSMTAVSTSSPPQFIVGDQNIESTVVSIPAGVAQAFQVTPVKGKNMTNIQIYLNADSTVTKLVVGIYSDDNGHPGPLSRSAILTAKAGTWSTGSVYPQSLIAGYRYWVAVLGLGTGGTVQLLGQPNGTGLTETSASNALTNLPSTWSIGSASIGGPVSAYMAGY